MKITKTHAAIAALAVALLAVPVAAQNAAALAGTKACAPNATGLGPALKAMDDSAAGFRSAQTSFVWTTVQMLPVEFSETESGTMYIRKEAGQLQMAADIKSQAGSQKYILYTNQTVQMYEAKSNRVTSYKAGKHRDAFESFMLLGFGGRGSDLEKSFHVRYCGMEMARGVNAYRLDLVPRAVEVRRMFDRIVLWIDPRQGVSVQQKFFQPEGQGYRLAEYSNIDLKHAVAGAVFSLKGKTNGKTEWVNP